jgi:two-component system, LytTR family, response regulator
MDKKITALLIDDEKNSREVLKKLLAKHCVVIEVIGEAADAEEAFDVAIKLKPQLVFLDIQMPRGNGFTFLKKFEKIPFEVIFVTSYDQYAITAIKFNALDYLLKPVDIEDLKYAVNKMAESLQEKVDKQPLIINLLQNVEADMRERKFAIHSGEKVKMLCEKDIIYIEGDGRYSHLHISENVQYTTPKNLKDFEDFFGNESTLIRISKTFILNATYIKEYSKGDPFIITMTDKKTFEVARRKKTEILEKLKGNK